MERYFILYKPYKMLSQFVRIPKKRCLADLEYIFPKNTQALGRLDDNSEGLLILSTDKKLTQLLLRPENLHERVYWVQVQGKVNEEELSILENGMQIRVGKADYITKPCRAKVIEAPKELAARERRAVKTELVSEWLELTLTEGKFHQVRKMCAGINHQVLRLFRARIEDLHLVSYAPGTITEISQEEIYSKLKISQPK